MKNLYAYWLNALKYKAVGELKAETGLPAADPQPESR